MSTQQWKAAIVAGNQLYRVEEICFSCDQNEYWVEIEAYSEHHEAPIPFRVKVPAVMARTPDCAMCLGRRAAIAWLTCNRHRRGISEYRRFVCLDCSEGWTRCENHS